MKKIFLLNLLLSITIFSMEIVNLKDGSKILIKDDFTWEELGSSKEETKVLLEGNPELLKKDLKAGVGVEVLSVKANNKNYELGFAINNNGTSSVIKVEADILLLDDDGNLLKTYTTNIYTGTYRLAETYIRVGSSKESKIKIDKVPNWNGKVRVLIKEVENR